MGLAPVHLPGLILSPSPPCSLCSSYIRLFHFFKYYALFCFRDFVVLSVWNTSLTQAKLTVFPLASCTLITFLCPSLTVIIGAEAGSCWLLCACFLFCFWQLSSLSLQAKHKGSMCPDFRELPSSTGLGQTFSGTITSKDMAFVNPITALTASSIFPVFHGHSRYI